MYGSKFGSKLKLIKKEKSNQGSKLKIRLSSKNYNYKFLVLFIPLSSIESLQGAEEKFYVDINKAMKSGYTPLHLSVIHGDKATCQLLLNCEPVVSLR